MLSSKRFNTSPLLDDDFLEKLSRKLSSLKITDSIKVITEELDNITKVINQFIDDKIEMVKPMVTQPLPIGIYYYPRATPASILFEENDFNSALSCDNKSIYEWDIDGQFKYQILTTLHNMLMYSTICRIVDNLDRQFAEFIIAGFFGQLKGWRDHYMTPLQKIEVLNLVSIDPNTTHPRDDVVYALITTILYHFIGDTATLKEMT